MKIFQQLHPVKSQLAGWPDWQMPEQQLLLTSPDGLEGNWVELRGHYINAVQFKKAFAGKFYLEL